MEQKVSIMRLKVDLQCNKCYKKVKKVLSKYPQIRDQLYDEKNNIVTIKVVCCSPEKIRDNICCQGGSTIKNIEIVEPPKPKPAPEKPKESEKPKEPEKKPEPQPGPPPKQDSAPPPAPVAKPVVMYPGTMPTSVVSYPYPYPSPMFGPRGNPEVYYGRPIYDSYGWSGPCYMGHQHHHCVYEEEQASVCTIS